MTLSIDRDLLPVNDHCWNALILIAIKYQNRLGKFRNIRYDRHVVYTVKNVSELASILVEEGAIISWSGGFRRLKTIEDRVVRDFRQLHDKYHTDP